MFDDKKTITDWFDSMLDEGGDDEGGGGDASGARLFGLEKKLVVVNRLHQILLPFMLRRQVTAHLRPVCASCCTASSPTLHTCLYLLLYCVIAYRIHTLLYCIIVYRICILLSFLPAAAAGVAPPTLMRCTARPAARMPYRLPYRIKSCRTSCHTAYRIPNTAYRIPHTIPHTILHTVPHTAYHMPYRMPYHMPYHILYSILYQRQ